MSLVGPRPLLVEEDCRIGGERRGRHSMSPGMTGHWQLLSFPRAPFEEMVELDDAYARSWSVGADVKLLARTIPYVARCRGI
jgi:lipopolysaccharide/colanic/teichoic acid biosynthesis glycosyltransferase